MTGKRESIVLTHGVFDLMHSNHVEALRVAKSFGDKLIVGVHSDAVAASYKRWPMLREEERLKQVQAVRYVDEAFIDPKLETAEMHEERYQQFKPDHYVYFGPGYDVEFEPWSRRGLLRRLPYHAGISTSKIIAEIQQRLESDTF